MLKVVTIKTVPRKIQGEFLLDVNRMMSLQHPHIITFYGISLPDAQLDIPLRLVSVDQFYKILEPSKLCDIILSLV